MGNSEINNVRHSANCICSLKSWAKEEDCDCDLKDLLKLKSQLEEAHKVIDEIMTAGIKAGRVLRAAKDNRAGILDIRLADQEIDKSFEALTAYRQKWQGEKGE